MLQIATYFFNRKEKFSFDCVGINSRSKIVHSLPFYGHKCLCSTLMAWVQVGVFFVPHLLWHVTMVFGVLPERLALNIIKRYLGLILTRVRKGGKWMYKLYIMEIVQGWSCHLELFFKLKMNSSLFYFTTTKNNEPFPIYCSGLINTTICICRGDRRVCIGLGPRRFAPIHSPPGLVRCLLGPVRSVCSGYPLEHYW